MQFPAMSRYRIRLALPSDPPLLPEVERAAASTYRPYMAMTGLTEVTIADTQSIEVFATAQTEGLLWVIADKHDAPVGFALLRRMEPGALHLWEFDVHPEHARRGLGTKLLRHVMDLVQESHLNALTLTTYRDVPWNAPFYMRMGFRILQAAEWTPALRKVREEEQAMGLNVDARVAMQFDGIL